MSSPELVQATVAVHDLAAAGIRERLGLAPGFADPELAAWEIANEVFTLGDTYLEVVAPSGPGSRLHRFLEGGAGGYLVALRVPDAAALAERCAALGVRIVHRQDLAGAAILQLHPGDLGVLVEADEMPPGRAWHYDTWDTPGRSPDARAGDLVAVDVAVADPAAMAVTWSRLFGLPVVDEAVAGGTAGGRAVRAGRGLVRFVPASGRRGLVALDLRAPEAGVIETAGLTIRLVPHEITEGAA
ncbi:hypothetical protein GCM10023194_49680 [Planotetraspora phitsanulokensis]|uniref:Glyoxalase-like domain-containing protein n=1 Tax=Planotetraspora phitsanulokensis TaxID=575192 RepID=A0A8J3U1P3_9ACTN|nr:VOC family protein [Planotetraspora phitsanulokensis]GII36953.1 hypothetical protein Pph01_19560 [Planotetraspora phitsanulokensis]